MNHARQRGVALLVAIVMFAIATTVAAAITYNKAMAARRAAASFTLEQALQAGMAAEALAAIALEDDGKNSKTSPDNAWAEPFGPVEIEGTGIWIQAQIEDLTSRFNLNTLVRWQGPPDNLFVANPEQVQVFRKLLETLKIDANFADLLVDWIDTDIAPQATQGGEDTLYLTQAPPYRPPNTFIYHPSEILALPGFGPERYALLAPYITALPINAKINPCTASGLVLDVTMNDPQNEQEFQLQDMPALRKKGCYPIGSVYTGRIGDPNLKTLADARIEEKSSWFRLRTNIRIGTAEFVLYSVLFRQQNNRVRTVQRSFGSE
ncbi:MAG TPA: type II secretion system minor pseudopilin GspK [Steroidobacteraceae bacterium]|nr:type II secretion system minor pseudopilin GspK [Steroidobacteraceae bacterium]